MAEKKELDNPKQPASSPVPPITRNHVAKAEEWLTRTLLHAERAVELSESLSLERLDESSDLCWALVKYVENVEESVKQLDNLNENIFPALREFSEVTWSQIKGMRDRLVHQFWRIDPQILWQTVTEDFPVLIALIRSLKVRPEPIAVGGSATFRLSVSDLVALSSTNTTPYEVGWNIVLMVFFDDRQVHIGRVGYEEGKGLKFHSNMNTRVSIRAR